MKNLPWILIVLSCFALFFRCCNEGNKTEKSNQDTVTVIDTIRDTVLKTVLVRFDHWDTAYFPLLTDYDYTDSINTGDSVSVAIPIETKEYKTDNYRAIVSGYKPNLDLMEVYSKTQTITITPKKQRWGLGLHAGYGYPGGWYIGAGISYNIISW